MPKPSDVKGAGVYYGPGGSIVINRPARWGDASGQTPPSFANGAQFNNVVKLLDYGVKEKAAEAFSRALDDLQTKGGGIIVVETGDYIWEAPLRYTSSVNIGVVGIGNVKMDASSITGDGKYILWLRGNSQDEPIQTGDLISNTSIGDVYITTNFDVYAGDILYLSCLAYAQSHFPPPLGDTRWAFAPSRSYYCQGEFNIVVKDAAAGTPVQLRTPLRHSYVATIGGEVVTKVMKLRMPKFFIDNLYFVHSYEGSSIVKHGIRLEGSRQPEVHSLRGSGFTGYGVSLRNCYGGLIKNCWLEARFSNRRQGYPVTIESCEDVHITSNELHGTLAGMSAVGGQHGPCRNICVEGNYIRSDPQDGSEGVDTHANGEQIVFRNNMVWNGFTIQAADVEASHNVILCKQHPAFLFSLEKENSNYYVLAYNTILALPTTKFTYGIQFRVASTETSSRTYEVKNFRIVGNNGFPVSTGTIPNFLIFSSNLSAGDQKVYIRSLILQDNYAITSGIGVVGVANVYEKDYVDYFHMAGNRLMSTGNRAVQMSGFQLVKWLRCVNNYFEAAGTNQYGFDAGFGNISDMDVEDNHFLGAGTNNYNRFHATGQLRLINNTFENFTSRRGIDASAATGYISGNRFINCTGTPVYPANLLENWFGQDYSGFPPPSNVVVTNPTSTQNIIIPSASNVIGLRVKGAASQSADLFRCLDNADNVLLRISQQGWLGVGNTATRPLRVYRAGNSGSVMSSIETDDSLGVWMNIKNVDGEWSVGISSLEEFMVRDIVSGNLTPVIVEKGTPSDTLKLFANGRVSIAAGSAVAKLAVRNNIDTNNVLRLIPSDAQTAAALLVVSSGGVFRFAILPDGNIGTSQTSTASTLGSVVRKLPIYSATGTLLGYVPIYDNIT